MTKVDVILLAGRDKGPTKLKTISEETYLNDIVENRARDIKYKGTSLLDNAIQSFASLGSDVKIWVTGSKDHFPKVEGAELIVVPPDLGKALFNSYQKLRSIDRGKNLIVSTTDILLTPEIVNQTYLQMNEHLQHGFSGVINAISCNGVDDEDDLQKKICLASREFDVGGEKENLLFSGIFGMIQPEKLNHDFVKYAVNAVYATRHLPKWAMLTSRIAALYGNKMKNDGSEVANLWLKKAWAASKKYNDSDVRLPVEELGKVLASSIYQAGERMKINVIKDETLRNLAKDFDRVYDINGGNFSIVPSEVNRHLWNAYVFRKK